MDEKKMADQKILFTLLQGVRLTTAKLQVSMDLVANTPVEKPNAGFFEGVGNMISNTVKNSRTQRLLDWQSKIDRDLESFYEKTGYSRETMPSTEEIRSYVSSTFPNDIYFTERTLFAVGLIFDKEYSYQYEREGLRFVSYLLFDYQGAMEQIKSDVERRYTALATQPLSDTQKMILAGIAAIAALSVVTAPAFLGGLSAAGITHGLATLGVAGTMISGIGTIAVAEALLDLAVFGCVYGGMTLYNKNEAKKAFREKNWNDTAMMLAVKCTAMDVAKRQMPPEEFKEKLSDMLQMIQDFKSDTDYLIFVENERIAENTKKIKIFHNLDDMLRADFCPTA